MNDQPRCGGFVLTVAHDLAGFGPASGEFCQAYGGYPVSGARTNPSDDMGQARR